MNTTQLLITEVRDLKERRGITTAQLREELNKDFLSKEQSVSIHALNSMFRKGRTGLSAELALALRAWALHHETTENKDKTNEH